jgi:hypothetical protein
MSVIGVIVLLIIGSIGGCADGKFDKCEQFGAKRYHYLMPTYTPACMAIRWLNNKQIFEEVR